MPTLYSAAALMVVAVYLVWRAYAEARQQRQRLLCRRVAYMLWVMAGADEDSGVGWGYRWPPTDDYGYE
jgi:hypothetical protein